MTKVLIKKTFQEQYRLIITMKSSLVDTFLQSTTQIRYDFNVLNITETFMECRIIQLDISLTEASNPLVKEIAQVTAAFNQMFAELHLKISPKGEILEVLNLPIILEKWARVKQDMLKATSQNEDVSKLISLNDSVFKNPKKIIQAIQSNEFLIFYFNNVYGNNLPFENKNIKPNFLNTAYIEWNTTVLLSDKTIPYSMCIDLKSEPVFRLTADFYKQAYASFSDKIEISKLYTKISEVGQYQIDIQTGKLIKAEIKRIENADKKLYTQLDYSLMTESVYQEKLKTQPEKYNTSPIIETQKEQTNREEEYIVYKGKKYTKQEWIKKEQDEWEQYTKKHNIKSEDTDKKNKGGRFFIDETKYE